MYRYRFAKVEFDEAKTTLRVAGEEVPLEPLPLQLLSLLLRRPGEVVTRAELFEALWPGRVTVDHVLANAVSKLRAGLRDAADHIVTVPRIGYRFVGSVDRTAVGRQRDFSPGLLPGSPVPGRPDFVLARPLGEGNVSSTWLAHNPKLRQQRVFKFACDGDQLTALKREYTVQRLLLEELGARQDRVILCDDNLVQAPFFLAYEYAGSDLRTWAKEAACLDEMNLSERLDLFLNIARAVAAAHAVGVLHRDLKPSNVLVAPAQEGAPMLDSKRWRVRLSDFGSSRVLDPERLRALAITQMGLTVTDAVHPLVGSTVLYLAPELLAGEPATTRSDLYALGLMLFQLLVADFDRPMATGWEGDIGDPLLVADIRAATEGRPERRLASVDQWIERLEGLERRRAQRLEEERLATEAKAAADRLRAVRQRRPWVVALCSCLAIGGIVSACLAIQARASQREAEQAVRRARVINEFLNIDVLRAVEMGQTQPGRMAWMAELLARASDRAGMRFKGDAVVLGQLRRQLGDLYLGLRFGEQAEYEYRRAIVVLEDDASGAGNADLLMSRFGLAQALTGRDRTQQAQDALDAAERAVALQTAERRDDLAQRALRARVAVMLDQGRYGEGLSPARQLVQATDATSTAGGIDQRSRIEARQWLGEACWLAGEKECARNLVDELAAPPFNAPAAGREMLTLARLRLAQDWSRRGHLDDAVRLLDEARAALPAEMSDEVLLAHVNLSLAEVHRRAGRYAEARREGDAALQVFSALLGDSHPLAVRARLNRALTRLDAGRPDEALRDLDWLRPRLAGEAHPTEPSASVELARARALTALGRRDEAASLLQALGKARAGLPPNAEFVQLQMQLAKSAVRGQ